MKKLSIIIPSYNTEKFIDKNMKTFIDERLYEDVEILIINDGSKDDTARKAQVYEDSYPGFVRVINKENGGHGSVINRGILEAGGEYFKVIDADDWVDTNNLLKLVCDLKAGDEDLVLNPYIKIDQQTRNTSIWGGIEGLDYNVEIDFSVLEEKKVHIALHSATIKTQILKDNRIVMTENCFYEDFEYTLYPIPFIRNCRLLDYPVYYYLVGQKTQSVNAYSSLKNISMYKKVMYDSIDYFNNVKESLSKNTKIYMESCISDYIRSMYNIYLRNGKVEEIRKLMMESDKELQKNSPYFYNLVGRNNGYIKLLRFGGGIFFQMISRAFCLYKRKEIS